MSGNHVKLGNKFVLRYYTTLHDNPEALHQFYKEKSVFTHGHEDGPEETVVGQAKINQKITALDYRDCLVKLSVVDCQESLDGGILVVVKGEMSKKGESPKKFLQTFFLAVQTEPQPGYYVLNDIFRYIKDGHPPKESSNAAEAVSVATEPAPVKNQESTPVNHTSDQSPANGSNNAGTQNNTAPISAVEDKPQPQSHAIAQQPVEKTVPTKVDNIIPTKQESKPQQNNKEAPVNPPKSTENGKEKPPRGKVSKGSQQKSDKPVEGNNETAPQTTQKVNKPTSWASIVGQKGADHSEQPQSHSPQQTNAHPASSQPSVPPTQPQTTPQNQQQTQPKQKISRDFPGLYVSNIPFSSTESQIRAVFVKWGEIKSMDVKSKGFCFIEYVDPSNVVRAIQDAKSSPVVLEGRTLVVEERKQRTAPANKPQSQNQNNEKNGEGEFRTQQKKTNWKSNK